MLGQCLDSRRWNNAGKQGQQTPGQCWDAETADAGTMPGRFKIIGINVKRLSVAVLMPNLP